MSSVRNDERQTTLIYGLGESSFIGSANLGAAMLEHFSVRIPVLHVTTGFLLGGAKCDSEEQRDVS